MDCLLEILTIDRLILIILFICIIFDIFIHIKIKADALNYVAYRQIIRSNKYINECIALSSINSINEKLDYIEKGLGCNGHIGRELFNLNICIKRIMENIEENIKVDIEKAIIAVLDKNLKVTNSEIHQTEVSNTVPSN